MFHQEYKEFTLTELINAQKKSDYINLVLNRVRHEMLNYEPDHLSSELVNKLLRKVAAPESMIRTYYLLSHTREFARVGKYLLFISKKLDDNQINFSNLIQNVSADSDFLKREILSYMSDPEPKKKPAPEIPPELPDERNEAAEKIRADKFAEEAESRDDVDADLEEDNVTSKIYLHLIQSDEHDEDQALELPTAADKETHPEHEPEYAPAKETLDAPDSGSALDLPEEGNSGDVSESENETEAIKPKPKTDTNLPIPEVRPDEGSFRIKRKLTFGANEDDLITGKKIEESEEKPEEVPETRIEAEAKDDSERISLSDELSTEIDDYIRKSETEPLDADENDAAANAEFLEYENEVRICNAYLSDEMTRFSAKVVMTDDERRQTISSVMEASMLLEERSRNMSFEIISDVYQAIYLSFEKIAEGKYDLSESTVSLLRQGLELIESLMRGEDYFMYKTTLKSIENIRRNLLEEKTKKEEYSKRVQVKEKIQKELNSRYPQKEQRIAVNEILSQIRNIESVLKSISNTVGEFHTFESLNILSGALGNLKNIVPLSKELNLGLLAQLSEAGYNFVKYLCNYKKDPAEKDNKEILDYLVYSLKSLLLGREIEDTDLFISYLNDPIRIYSKQQKHQTTQNTDE